MSPPRTGPPHMNDPRKKALHILNRLDSTGKTLDIIMEEADATGFMDRRERAFLNALVYGTLRWRGRLDAIIAQFSKIPLEKIDPRALNVLRMGVFQTEQMDGVPVSAAVNTSVELVKSFSGSWVANFVNAVLRNAHRKRDQIRFPGIETDPAGALAAQKSFPQWLIKRWLKRFGIPETQALCDAINNIPPMVIRTNRLAAEPNDLISALKSEHMDAAKTPFSPTGVAINGPAPGLFTSKPFLEGWFQVQDEAAQLVTWMMGLAPGDKALDACAGLGGKTGHMAQLMENRGSVLAMDRHSKKLEKLAREMERLGVRVVKTAWGDISKKRDAPEMFDKVMLDAPCSGLGVLRRNPDAKWSMTEQRLKRSAKRQSLFLDHMADWVKPSGSLTYVVCSMEPEENEDAVKKFLERRPEFRLDKTVSGFPENARHLIRASGFFKSYPHRHQMDGFFAACFKKK